MPGTRKLGRPTDHRMAMLRAMVTYLLEKGRIETTVTRAKEVRSLTEKMITLGKENTLNAKRQVFAFVTKEAVIAKLFNEIAPKFEKVSGGYTRIIKIGPRRGDAAEMAFIEIVGFELPKDKKAGKDAKATKTAEKPEAAPKAATTKTAKTATAKTAAAKPATAKAATAKPAAAKTAAAKPAAKAAPKTTAAKSTAAKTTKAKVVETPATEAEEKTTEAAE